MGMYTEIYINVNLKKDTPEEVINILKKICENKKIEGKPNRWQSLFCSCSYYTPNTCCANLVCDEISNIYSLLGKGDIKNCESEIEAFFDWIEPYVATRGEKTFIGYKRHEEEIEPTLIYIDHSFKRY